MRSEALHASTQLPAAQLAALVLLFTWVAA
jgi:hypothetical protein